MGTVIAAIRYLTKRSKQHIIIIVPPIYVTLHPINGFRNGLFLLVNLEKWVPTAHFS